MTGYRETTATRWRGQEKKPQTLPSSREVPNSQGREGRLQPPRLEPEETGTTQTLANGEEQRMSSYGEATSEPPVGLRLSPVAGEVRAGEGDLG